MLQNMANICYTAMIFSSPCNNHSSLQAHVKRSNMGINYASQSHTSCQFIWEQVLGVGCNPM